MKRTTLALLLLAAMAPSFAATITAKSPQQDQLGYSYGYVMGRTNADTLKDLNLETFIQGVKDGATGKPAALSDEDMSKALSQYKKQIESKQLNAFKKVAEENQRQGEKFLADNAKKPGIITTASGLQYQVLQAGTGKPATINSTVKVNYEGRLLDGTVFDSSIARNHPVEFKLNQVIQGWVEGIQTMKEGGKTRLFIPAKLAYGEIGSGDAIGPNSVLIFDVELLKVSP